ncbi:MAG: methyl-accepting chemotaxis protein [Acetatifactor sp.]|nr:methyl-accepting chemotaxis protein [Acetatifactor sp.]
MKTQNSEANVSQKDHKKKVFGIQKKLLCIILPLFLLSFVVTATLIFVNSAQTILANSKRTLEKEAVSNMKTVSINLLQRTGSTGIGEAYGRLSLRPTALQGLYDDVAEIRIMDTGYACLIDTRSQTILSHGDPSLTGTVLSDYSSGTFLGDLGALVSSGSTSITSISDGMEQYYVIVSYIDGTPWALVSYISENYILSDLANLLYTILAIFLIIMAIVFVVVSITIRGMLKPIKGLTQVLTTIADGDFSVEIKTKGNDEIAVMSRSLEDFVSIMREVIQDIHNVSGQLSVSSGTTKSIAGALNTASEAQAESMGDVQITIDQVAGGVQDLADHAVTLSEVVTATTQRSETALENMQTTVKIASKGRDDMQTVGGTMSTIVESIKHLKDIVTEVGDSTDKISSMATLISDISDQTNLLSLNAAIEAARAGEAGRGFAVVAEEIRKLAETSADSAAQITKIIEQISTEVSDMIEQTSQSVTYIEENSKKVTDSCQVFENIYQNVSDSGKMLTEIVGEINQVEDVATNIAALSQEQSASTAEIQASAETLSTTSLQFSNDSRKVSESADEVSAAAFTLTEHMKRFKI